MTSYRHRLSRPSPTSIELSSSIRSNQQRAAYLAEFIARVSELISVHERVKLATLSTEEKSAQKRTLQ